MTEDDPLTLAGRRLLDRYRIERCLARGGMSVVYRGADERLGRPVSIKIYCASDPSSPTYRAGYEHFLGEVAALARLRHPHTLRIYDVGFLDAEGYPFHVCEYVDGGTLRGQVKRHGPLDVAAAAALLGPILGALDEAHACGLVHADVKPANVLLVDVGGRRLAKLADFGISRRLAIASAAIDTQPDTSGMRLFSPGWAAPEQIRGDGVSAATDVFGAGLLFAFAVTGKRALPTAELIGLVEHCGDVDAFVRTRFDRLHLPAELRSVLGRACRADPDMRFSTITELRDALKDAASRVANVPLTSIADSETTARFHIIA